jgi:hypothetical protein
MANEKKADAAARLLAKLRAQEALTLLALEMTRINEEDRREVFEYAHSVIDKFEDRLRRLHRANVRILANEPPD